MGEEIKWGENFRAPEAKEHSFLAKIYFQLSGTEMPKGACRRTRTHDVMLSSICSITIQAILDVLTNKIFSQERT